MAQRDQQIVEQVRAGSSLVAAARAFGLSHVAVWHICERAGVRFAVAAGPAPLAGLDQMFA